MKKLFSVLLSVAVLFTFVGTGISTVLASSESAKEYSGEEIFRGVVIGQGEVAYEFDHLWNKKNLEIANHPENVALVDQVIAEMKEKNPNYFHDFESAIKSGDFAKTDALLVEGSEQFKNILESKASVNLDEDVVDANCLVLALNMVAVYSHAAILTFYLETLAVGPGFNSASNSTEREALVADIVEFAS